MPRTLEDCTHDYLVERVIDGERYLSELVQMLGQFHPYLQPALNDIAEAAKVQSDRTEAKFPVGRIVLPKPH